MQIIVDLDLTADAAASIYVKDEIVDVTFATYEGEIVIESAQIAIYRATH